MQKVDNLYVSELEFDESGMRGPQGKSGDAPSLYINKVAPFLYKSDCKEIDYEAAEIFVRENYPDTDSACASIKAGALFGHNYDARYDNTAEFVVRTPARKGAHGSLGVAAIPGVLTADMVDAETESELTEKAYDVLPLFMVDGVNDKGVSASLHHLPEEDVSDMSDDSGMCALFAVRYIMDHANSAAHAIELIQNMTFWYPKNDKIKAGFYLLIADKTSIYFADLNGNSELVENGNLPILTNFRTIGWDGTKATLETHANGVERYNILCDAYEGIETREDMMDALKSVRYTGAYDNSKEDFWYSDYNGDWAELGFGELTIDSQPNEYAAAVTFCRNEFLRRIRDGATMHTVHTAVYNLDDLTLDVMVQEENTVYKFCMDEMNLFYSEVERAKAAEQAIRDDFADAFYTKPEVDDSLSDLREEVLGEVDENYYNSTEVDNIVSDMHEQIGSETDTKLEGKADAFENEGEPGQVLYKTNSGAAWDDLPPQLPEITAADESKVLVVENGEWVASDRFADYIRYVNITVSIASDNGGVPSGNITVTIKDIDTGDVINQETYNGQPVTFRVPRGLSYRIEQSGVWEGYHNPSPAMIEGVATNDTSVVFTYEAIQVPETLRELQIIVDSGSASSLRNHIGLQFEDTYTELGREYPIIWDLKDVLNVEDENGQVHTGVVLEWHYATPTSMPFDAPERLEVDLSTESTAQAGTYYYGVSSNTYRYLSLSTGDPIPTTYDAVFKNSIRNTDANIIRRGYSNYAESAVRKWLISDQPAGSWWSATHVGDMPPDAAAQLPGFMSGCSSQILSMAKPVKIKYAVTSDTYNTVCDRFFIPSVDEVYGLSHNVAEGVPWQDWVEATGLNAPDNSANSGRRIFGVSSSSASAYVGLRTANVGYQYIVWDIKANGSLDGYANANTLRQYTPCCVVY